MSKNWTLIVGHADRTVKWGRPVAIEIHERVHAIWIEGDEFSAGSQNTNYLTCATRRIGKMMDQATEQNAVKAAIGEL